MRTHAGRLLLVLIGVAFLATAGGPLSAAPCGHEHKVAAADHPGCAGEGGEATTCSCGPDLALAIAMVTPRPDHAKAVLSEAAALPAVRPMAVAEARPARDKVPRSPPLWLLTARLRL